MTDLIWPDDPVMAPKTVSFYLQSHTGRATSPLTRATKVYGLSRPLWVAKLTFTGSWRGGRGMLGRGPRLDALIAAQEGGANRIAIWDFRRPRLGAGAKRASPATTLTYVGDAAGATTLHITGFSPGALAFRHGDYVGGDQRAHLVNGLVYADGAGVAAAPITPSLVTAVTAGDPAVIERAASWFRLTSDDAGANDSTANGQASYSLEYLEDPWW